MDLKSISTSMAKQSHAKEGLQEPNENSGKKSRNRSTSAKGTDKVSLSAKGMEHSAITLKLVAQLHKMTQADPETAVLSFGNLDLSKATALLQ